MALFVVLKKKDYKIGGEGFISYLCHRFKTGKKITLAKVSSCFPENQESDYRKSNI